MTLNSSRDNVPDSPLRLSLIERKLTQPQVDLMFEALQRGVADVRNALAYRLSEPLSALLLYLREIKRVIVDPVSSRDVPASVRTMSEMALLEAERINQIVAPEADRANRFIETGVACRSDGVDLLASGRGVDSNVRLLEPTPLRMRHLLTPREQEVLALITGGASSREGGMHLGISKRTFEAHRRQIMRKFGARNAADLVRMALGTPMLIDPICVGPTGANTGYSKRTGMPSGITA
jgi:DNA-binding CsgD family transcriptional regulator